MVLGKQTNFFSFKGFISDLHGIACVGSISVFVTKSTRYNNPLRMNFVTTWFLVYWWGVQFLDNFTWGFITIKHHKTITGPSMVDGKRYNFEGGFPIVGILSAFIPPIHSEKEWCNTTKNAYTNVYAALAKPGFFNLCF